MKTYEDLHTYDTYIVPWSGGKDSLSCLLSLIKAGIPREKIELWHQNIDGEESRKPFMDWPVTADYCRKVANHFGIKIFFSWKEEGFKGEMLRENQLTKPTHFETPTGTIKTGGTRGKKSTRLKFPQVSANLSVRWCSAYLKIDVASTAIRNQKRFNNSRTLVLSGERAEESTAREGYSILERDRTDNRDGRNKRHVDRFRPIHQWKESQVWELIKEFRVNPHPAYWLGFGRCSCMFCIFGSKNQIATAKNISPDQFTEIAEYEELFEVTIKRGQNIKDYAAEGEVYPAASNQLKRITAMSKEFTEPIILDNWRLPPGAFGESCGPS